MQHLISIFRHEVPGHVTSVLLTSQARQGDEGFPHFKFNATHWTGWGHTGPHHGEQSLISPLASKLQRYLPRSLHCKSARNSSSHTSQLSILTFLQDEVQTQCQGLLGVHEGKPWETFKMSPRILQASSRSGAGHTEDARPSQIGKERRYNWGINDQIILTRFSPCHVAQVDKMILLVIGSAVTCPGRSYHISRILSTTDIKESFINR